MNACRTRSSQRGGTAVEFALVMIIFCTFLLAVIDLSRMLYMWNAANEATRAGARYAVVCDNTGNQAAVLARMQQLLPQISAVSVTWSPSGCGVSTCEGVAVSVTGMNYQWISPIAGLAMLAPFPMPGFSTYLPREMMRQDPNSAAICG